MSGLMWVTVFWVACVATLTILLFVLWVIDKLTNGGPFIAEDPWDKPTPTDLKTLAEYRRQRGQRFTVIDGDRHRPG